MTDDDLRKYIAGSIERIRRENLATWMRWYLRKFGATPDMIETAIARDIEARLRSATSANQPPDTPTADDPPG